MISPEQIRAALELRNHHERRIEEYKAQVVDLESRIKNLEALIEKNILERQRIEESQITYQKAVDLVYERSIGEIEETLNIALAYIFYDRNYRIKFDLGDRRGKSVELLLLDETRAPARTRSMKNGVGNGIRTVVSYILLTLYMTSRGIPPILFSDEGFSAISESYVDRFFTFVRGLSVEKQAPLILISHDDRFLPYADQKIQVQDGKVTVL